MKHSYLKQRLPLLALGLGIHLFWLFLLLIAAANEMMILGILAICGYRLTLWASPFVTLLILWFPTRANLPAKKKLLITLIALAANALLFPLCRVLFGAWF
ncbi:MAG: hypothetical protein E7620_06925 [Ruminococcaceae bacterium]|nr:hypothetical protein [Oscillospiraceae bacterium]